MSVEMGAALSSSEEGFPGMPGATPTMRSLNLSLQSSPRSLMISSDLDALLEHEERTRLSPTFSPTSAWAPTFTANSTEFVAFTSSFPIGLPPPPRGPRRPRPPSSRDNTINGVDSLFLTIQPIQPVQSIAITEAPPRYSRDPASLPGTPTSGANNPYINPPPTLQDFLLHVSGNTTSDRQSENNVATSGVDQSQERIDGTSTTHDEWVEVSQYPGDSRMVDQRLQEQPRSPTSRVDRLLNKALTRFQDYSSNSPEERPSSSSSSDSTSSGGKGRKLFKVKSAANGNGMRRAGNQGVRGQGSPKGDEATSGVGRRPLCISHGVASSPSSLEDSDGLTDSVYPASSTNPRLSISSTIYPASSVAYTTTTPLSMRSPSSSPPPDLTGNSSSRHRDSGSGSFIEFSPERSESSRETRRFRRKGFTSGPSARSRSRSPQPSSLTTTRRTPVPRPVNPTPSSRSTSPVPNNRVPDLTLNANGGSLPPTTNFLDVDERADLIRKSRKLAQVFGQPLGPDILSQQEPGRNLRPKTAPRSRSHHRHALSVTVPGEESSGQQQKAPWPPEGTKYMSANGRRHSSPLSPDEFSFLSEVPSSGKTTESDGGSESDDTQKGGHENRRQQKNVARASMVSFMDLSDEESVDHHRRTAVRSTRPHRPPSPSYQSLYENMTPEEQAEEDRRKKREKLARLHRFLGSRVPPDLVLGIDIPPTECMLPPAAFDSAILGENDTNAGNAWARRRRSSSAAAFSATWSDSLDRLKEDLGEKEKAINVRRALKMEKVFGVAPPQTLYHTRQSPAPSSNTPTGRVPGYTNLSDAVSTSVANVRNFNRSSYLRNKAGRPGTSESSRHLLPKTQDVTEPAGRSSAIFTHYQHSLNSLNDIIDRDDRESLAELHEYMQSGDLANHMFSPSNNPLERQPSTASAKERRRSLPVRSSVISLASEYSVATVTSPRPEITDFQLRRRRAAKLTQFFGVDYRELINDVLESIENGLEHEHRRGTLNAEEVQDLLRRLRALRTKRQGAL